jgi:hypothetical protein
MAINPELITTIRVDQLPDETLSLTNLFPHTVGTDLKSATIQELVDLVATAIGVSGGVGYIAISVTDGQQLPDVPELPSFFLCGAGTYLNINGYPDVICTDELNAVMSLTDHWQLAVGIPIVAEVGVQSVTGSAVDNTDPLNPVINSTGGGGTQTLAEVLIEGNITDGTDISISDGDKIVLDNGANLKKGTTDAGLGGTKGIALRCAVDYELKWEAGRLYVMGGDGFTIREVSHNFTTTPTVNDDDTKGFVVDSRWILDNGDVYVCTDDTTGAAVWELVNTGTTPTLQQVLNEGNTATTNNLQIIVGPVDDLSSILSMTPSTLITGVDDAANNKYVSDTKDITNGYELSVYDDTLSLNSANKIVVPFKTSGSGITNFKVQNNLPAGDYELATLDDIPTGGGIPHATASGTDTYTATVTGVAAYNDADAFLIRFTNGNTTGATLNINSLGAKTLYRNNDGALIGGDIINGGEMLCIYNTSLNGFQVIGTAPNSLFAYVTNDDSVTLTKGMPVYAFSGTGDRMTVKRANNTTDATSAQTVGLVLSTSIGANQKGLIMMQGLLDGLSILPTSTFADGDAIYLGATDGTITNVKPYAPNHLVYLGVVTTASNGSAGRMYVRVQNGYELSEIHDVDLISNAPINNQALTYETSTDLWKNKTIIEDNITNGVTTIAPSQNAVFDALALKFDASSYNWMLTQAYGLLGSTIKGVNLTCPTFAQLSATSLGTGVGRYLSYYLPQAATITGVKFFQPNQGVYTGNNYNGVGLYSYSGGTLTLVASTTNDTEFWKGTSATWITKPFSSTYSAAAGIYYLFALYNSSAQTTAPTILFNAYNSNNFPAIDFTNSAKLGGTSNSGTTALPTPTVATTSINGSSAGSGLILLY